jgi:hypothetical protein
MEYGGLEEALSLGIGIGYGLPIGIDNWLMERKAGSAREHTCLHTFDIVIVNEG